MILLALMIAVFLLVAAGLMLPHYRRYGKCVSRHGHHLHRPWTHVLAKIPRNGCSETMFDIVELAEEHCCHCKRKWYWWPGNYSDDPKPYRGFVWSTEPMK